MTCCVSMRIPETGLSVMSSEQGHINFSLGGAAAAPVSGLHQALSLTHTSTSTSCHDRWCGWEWWPQAGVAASTGPGHYRPGQCGWLQPGSECWLPSLGLAWRGSTTSVSGLPSQCWNYLQTSMPEIASIQPNTKRNVKF